jgi:hypothetical protein
VSRRVPSEIDGETKGTESDDDDNDDDDDYDDAKEDTATEEVLCENCVRDT